MLCIALLKVKSIFGKHDTCIAQVLAVLLLNLLEVRVDRARDVDEAICLNLEVAVSQLLQRLCGKPTQECNINITTYIQRYSSTLSQSCYHCLLRQVTRVVSVKLQQLGEICVLSCKKG